MKLSYPNTKEKKRIRALERRLTVIQILKTHGVCAMPTIISEARPYAQIRGLVSDLVKEGIVLTKTVNKNVWNKDRVVRVSLAYYMHEATIQEEIRKCIEEINK